MVIDWGTVTRGGSRCCRRRMDRRPLARDLCAAAGMAAVDPAARAPALLNLRAGAAAKVGTFYKACKGGSLRNVAGDVRSSSPLRVGDFVISAAQELDETNAVTEGIGHVGDATPPMRLDLALDRGTCFNCPTNSSLKF